MYLKTLAVKGFKSFADSTKLYFEPGITVVVGPNGSGKSNITDAVLWVLGEQSAISLRGTAMEDVIFAGSPTRESAGLAEVSLTLDNSDEALPIEFSEVSITRRISRMGDSEYLINNVPCRLLDVQELLMDSGLGKEMYSIVSQGKLEHILVSKPEERRMLIEEAAGVLKHKIRKERAMRKLISMEQNLVRAKDVLKEINHQIQPLERQARKAERHRKVAESVRDLEICFDVRHLEDLQDEWAELAANESNWERSLEELQGAIAKEDEKQESLRKRIEKDQAHILRLEEKKRRFQTCFDRLSSTYLLAQEKGKALTLRRKELGQKIDQLKQRIGRRKEESLALSEKKSSFQLDKKMITNRLVNLEAELENCAAEETRLTKELDMMEKQRATVDEKHSWGERSLNAVQSETETLEVKSVFNRKQADSCLARIKKLQGDVEEGERDSEERRNQCQHWEREKTSAEKAIKQVDAVLRDLKTEIEKKKEQIAALKAEKKAYEDFKEALGDLSGAESVRNAELSGFMGVLGELIRVPKKYERALEAVLGTDLLCLTVKKYDHAAQILSFMQKAKKGPFGLIVTEGMDGRRLSQQVGESFTPISGFVECSNDLKPFIQHLLNNVFVVPDVQIAIKLLKERSKSRTGYTLVTQNGEVFSADGKIYTGKRRKLLKMLQGHSVRKFEAETKKHLDSLRGLERKQAAKSASRQELASKLQSWDETLKEHQFALQACLAEQQRTGQEIYLAEEEQKALADEHEHWESRIEEKEQIRTDLAAEIRATTEEVKEMNARVSGLKAQKQSCLEQRKELEREVNKARLQLDTLSQKEDYMVKQTGLISEDQNELQQLLDSEIDLETLFNQFASRLGPLEGALTELTNVIEELLGTVAHEISKKKGSILALKNTGELERAHSSELREQSGTITERIQNVRILKAQLEVEVTSISQRIVEQFEVPLDRAVETHRTNRTREDLREEIDRLKRQIKEMGAVNPIAVEDFNALKERHSFLSDQINDLAESRKALEKVAREIDKKIKDRFLHTFDQVNFHFQTIFSYLFEGGEAELVLDQPEDVLNSGISMSAHPAGKRLQKVTLLSGGEAALVALAFLFAIHHTRPSPFYILDEVEPALDSINLSRFTDFLESQSKKTQFLIITHQKRTMEIADMLYGVSMEPEGVSSVISQKLADFPEREDRRAYVS